MIRKLVSPVAIVMTLALVGLPGLQGAGQAEAKSKNKPHTAITIMVGGLSKQIYLPNELTQRLGFFDKEGLDVTLIDEPSGVGSEDAVIAGQVEAGSGAYGHTIELQALGKNIVDVIQFGVSPGEAEMVAASQAGGIHSFADLRGKNLGITSLGSGTHTLSQYLLLKAGVPVDQVHFIPVGAGDTFINAMQKGAIDAGMTTEPTITRLVTSGVGKVLVDLRTPTATRKALGHDFPFICLFMRADYVKSHKSVVQHVVNAYVRTLKWIHTHSASVISAKLPSDYYAGNEALYINSLKAQMSMFSPTGLMPKGGPETVLALEKAVVASVQGKNINLKATYTNTYVQTALKLVK